MSLGRHLVSYLVGAGEQGGPLLGREEGVEEGEGHLRDLEGEAELGAGDHRRPLHLSHCRCHLLHYHYLQAPRWSVF